MSTRRVAHLERKQRRLALNQFRPLEQQAFYERFLEIDADLSILIQRKGFYRQRDFFYHKGRR